MAVTLQRSTLLQWWQPAGVCAIPALALGLLCGKCMRVATASTNRLINATAATIVAFSLLLGGFYTLNYYNSDSSTAIECKAKVLHKHSEVRTESARAGRHGVTRKRTHTEYIIDIHVPDFGVKKITVKANEYSRISSGSNVTLTIERGLFGPKVIKRFTLPLRNTKKNLKYKKPHTL